MKKALVVLNGKPPGRRLLKNLTQQSDFTITVDGGSNTLLNQKLPFDILIGDLDSADVPRVEALGNVKIIQETGQDDTDMEKALRWVITNTPARDIVITGGLSEEMDHSLGNMSVAVKFAANANIKQVEDSVIIYYAAKRIELDLEIGTVVSLVALGFAEGITTEGLKWGLNRETLKFGVRDGIHNIVVNKKVIIEARDGCVAVMVKKTKGASFRW